MFSYPIFYFRLPSQSSNFGTGSVAAKIMARYGFKDGQGLGKQEQGMSVALQVEKTSKRGGRIVHEKDLMPLSSSSRNDYFVSIKQNMINFGLLF